MQNSKLRTTSTALISLLVLLVAAPCALAQTATSIPKSALVPPEELNKSLHTALPSTSQRPVILQIGPHMLFVQAHIPGAEYVGAAGTPDGLEKLRTRVKTLKKSDAIVLYCGCCPWEHCPNVAAAYNELQKLGFRNVKALYIANNFGADWVDKGYATAKGD